MKITKLAPWLGAAAIIVIIFGTIYAVVQQEQRSAANFPQIQMAEDTAAALKGGARPQTLVQGNIDMATSLAPFTIIFARTGEPIITSGSLNGQIPQPPLSMLTAAAGKPYSQVTWQPQANVRVAAVTVATDGYYVLSGRSLREVESNETRTLEISSLGALASLLVLGVIFLLQTRQTKS